jgi:hypothetical protein
VTEGPIVYPDITGVITSIDASSNPVNFRVVWAQDMGQRSDFRFDVVDVSAERELKVDNDGMGKPLLSLTDLRVGDIVAVYLNRQVAESYPPRGKAWEIGFLGKHRGELPKVPGLDAPESTSTP